MNNIYGSNPVFNPQPKKGKKPPKKQKPIPKVNKAKPIPRNLVLYCFKRDLYKCQYCDAPSQVQEQHSLHCNHIERQSQGGKHVLRYLATCCAECHLDHGRVSAIDKRWLKGENVFKGGRIHDPKKHKSQRMK